MKKTISVLFLTLCAAFCALAQRPEVRAEVLADANLAAGLDAILQFDGHQLTAAPEGYEPCYISHYGRHGSRYAYTAHTYTDLLDMLDNGHKNNNLTPYGEGLRKKLKAFYTKVQYQVGDLAPAGWEQQTQIAAVMARNYPQIFEGEPVVDACASSSIRSILSMSAFCLSLGQNVPSARIMEHQGQNWIQATAPNMGKNPFRYKGSAPGLPYIESMLHFMDRKLDYNKMLGRMFINTKDLLKGKDVFWTIDYIYMLVAGMNSLPADVAVDVSDIFTPEEYATMWEVDNYARFLEYYKYLTSCSAIIDDMIAKADERLASGSRGADLRFGHDHCMMPLLYIANIDGFGHECKSADEVAIWFQSFRSGMGTNLQFVFYRPQSGKGDVLVKVLHNGEEVRMQGIDTVTGPYYSWSVVKNWLNSRTALFVTQR